MRRLWADWPGKRVSSRRAEAVRVLLGEFIASAPFPPACSMTPRITDSDGAVVSMEVLRRMSHMPALRASSILGLGEDFLREGEFLRVIFVRGTYFHRDAITELVGEGGGSSSVELVPEPDNLNDHFAVAVHLDGLRVGYVPKELAFDLRDLFSAGSVRVVGISEIATLPNGYGIALLLGSPANADPVFPPTANLSRAFAAA